MIARSAICTLAMLALGACVATAPSRPVESDAAYASDLLHQEILAVVGPYDEGRVQAYVQRVGQRLAAQYPAQSFTFTVLDSPDIVAFSLAGGYIYVTRGLLAHLNSEAQLAAVLAHEIGHVVSRHHARQQLTAETTIRNNDAIAARIGTENAKDVAAVFSAAQIRGYGREQELEADRVSVRQLAAAGYDPRALAELMRFFEQYDRYVARYEAAGKRALPQKYDVFATHPHNAQREAAARAEIDSLRTTAGKTLQREYFAAIDNIVYGLSPKQGVQRGAHYYSPHGFTLTLPDGWALSGLREELTVQAPGQSGLMTIVVRDNKKAETPRTLIAAKFDRGEIKQGTAFSVGRFGAYTAILQQRGGPGRARVAAVAFKHKAVLFVGVALDPAAFPRLDAGFTRIVRSLAVAPGKIAPLRLHVRTPPTAFAKQPGLPPPGRVRLDLLNQHFSDAGPAPAGWRKVVE